MVTQKKGPRITQEEKKKKINHRAHEQKRMLVSDRLFPSPRSHAMLPSLPEPIHSHIHLTSLGALEETFGLDPRIHSCPPHAAPSSVGQTSHTRREGKGNEFIGLGSEFQGLWGIFIHTRKSSLPVMLPPRGVAMWTSSSPSISGRVCWALPCDFSWF